MRTRQELIGHRSTIAATSIVLGMLFGLSRANAQSAEAESLFSDGNKLMADGKLAAACASFEASNRVEPRAGTLIRLGECREKNQQLASAWAAYKDARNLATDPRKRQFAMTRAVALEPRLSYLTVVVSDHARIAGLAIARNDKPFDPMLWNKALAIDRGDYVITGRAPGYDTWQRTVHVPAEGARLSVDVPPLTKTSAIVPRSSPSSASSTPTPTLPTIPPVTAPITNVVTQNVNIAPAPPPSVIIVPAIDHSFPTPQSSSKVAPLIVATGALALLGGGLGFELWAESSYAAAKSEMTSQVRRDSLYNSANTKRYIAEGIAAGGLMAVGAAVWLYVRDNRREHEAVTHAGMHVVPTVTGLFLSGQF